MGFSSSKSDKIDEQKDKQLKNKIQKKDKIKIIYNIGDENEIRLFGDKFVKRYRNKFKLIINKREGNICSHINIPKNIIQIQVLEVILKGISDIKNLSYMFSGSICLVNVLCNKNSLILVLGTL